MEHLYIFFLKSFLSGVVMLVCYWLFLRNRSFHQFNRFFLLVTLLASIAVPCCGPNWFNLSGAAYSVFGPVRTDSDDISWILLISVGISVFLLARLTIGIVRLFLLKRRYASKYVDGIRLIDTELPQAPFAFFNMLFWRTDIPLHGESGNRIYRHELAHIREKHSYDRLFSQILARLFWINPCYWIIEMELNMVHEFTADSQAVEPGDSGAFAQMLLSAYPHQNNFTSAHFLSQSPIKRRLTMVGSRTNHRLSNWRKWSVIPALVFSLVVCSFTMDRLGNDLLTKQKSEKLAAERAYGIVHGSVIKK